MYIVRAIDKISNPNYWWLCSFSLLSALGICRIFHIEEVDVYLGVGGMVFIMFNVWSIIAGLVHIFIPDSDGEKQQKRKH